MWSERSGVQTGGSLIFHVDDDDDYHFDDDDY